MDLRRLAFQDLIMDASSGNALAGEDERRSDGAGDGDGAGPFLLANSPLIRFVDDPDPDPVGDAPAGIDRASEASIAAEFEENMENVREADRFVAMVGVPILDGGDVDRQGQGRFPHSPPSPPAASSSSPSRGDGWIVVNVGGIRQDTTVETLCMDSASMLAAWVLRYRGEGERELRIDRDGERFRHVLNYLRCGTLWLDDLPSLRGVYEEAKFYQLKGLKALCQERMMEMEARQAAESKRRKEEIEEALRAAFFSWERDRACHYTPKGKNEVLAILRGRRLGISEPPRFDMDADF